MENKLLIENKNTNKSENKGLYKQAEFELFAIWLSLPPLMKRPPAQKNGMIPGAKEFAQSMGIDNEQILELIELKTQKDFAERFDLSLDTLTDWKVKIKEQGLNGIPMMQSWAQTMSTNLLMSLYQHAMKKGNPLTIKLWFQLVDNWKENIKVEHTLQPITFIEHANYEPKTPNHNLD